MAFPSTKNAVGIATEMLQHGHPIEACELMDAFSMRAANESRYAEGEYEEAPTLVSGGGRSAGRCYLCTGGEA